MSLSFDALATSLRPTSTARSRRLARVLPGLGAGTLVVPLDHGLAAGPVVPEGWSLDRLVATLAASGADAVVLRAGAVDRLAPQRAAEIALVVHLNGAAGLDPDPLRMRVLTSVEQALRLGADAVSFHLNVGAPTTADQLAELGEVAEHCHAWGVPLLVMAYPRGPGIRDPHDPALILHAVTIAAELGADVVKTLAPRDASAAAALCLRSPVPLVFAGGSPRTGVDDFDDVRDLMGAGAAGMAMGRRLFTSADVAAATSAVSTLIHGPQPRVPASNEELHHAHTHH